MVVEGDVVVVVDGAGLPRAMRAGCNHTVAWFARSIAVEFHAALTQRTGTMSDALALAISRVADAHSSECDLDAGSPSATVAAWRQTGRKLEYLVLCDASLILVDRRGHGTGITDGRLERLVDAAMADIRREDEDAPPAEVRKGARVKVEELRNREDGFWCINSDPLAAEHALTGEVALDDLAGVIACSDGATRAYDLLSISTLDHFAAKCLGEPLASIAAAVRKAEDEQSSTLGGQGFKVHDDFTIVAASPH